MRRLALLLVVPMVLAGCAGYDNLSGAQKGGLIGAGTGAAAGAIIGSQVSGNRSGHAGTGAIIGALGGAAAGALIGDSMEKKPANPGQDRGQLPPVPPPPGPPGSAGPPPSQASVTVPGQYPSDPTRGQLVNSTPFKVQVYIDSDPNRGGSNAFAMNPNEVLPVNLDVGAHRIVAIATRDTQFGPRTVGRLDRPVNVDVRGAGWEMRFNEGDFR